ncbi:MAG: MTH1187 family thiamine-binding protein [bacterium]|nr:MTH1187 family thiamine-binding protein [bacterium]
MLASFYILPLDKGESLSEDVSEIVLLAMQSGLKYRIGAMETTIEGDPDPVWSLLRRCHEGMRARSSRVLTQITIDDRQNALDRMEGKIRSIESHIRDKKGIKKE